MFTTTLQRYFGDGDDASGYLAECKGYLQFMRRNEQRKEEIVYGGDTNKSASSDSSSGDIDSDIDVDYDVTDSLFSPTSVELLKKQVSLRWSLHLVADMLGNITSLYPHPIMQSLIYHIAIALLTYSTPPTVQHDRTTTN